MFVERVFEPAQIAIMQSALDEALVEACRHRRLAAGLELTDQQTRDRLARAIIEGAQHGIESKDQLRRFALHAIPAARRSRLARPRHY